MQCLNAMLESRPCLVKISGNADYYFVTFLCTLNEMSSIVPSIQHRFAFSEILYKLSTCLTQWIRVRCKILVN